MKKSRRSRSGTLILYGDAILAATTNLQDCASLSSTKAVHLALAEVIKTLIWLGSMLDEHGIKQYAWTIFQDDNGCLEWATAGAAKHFNKRKSIDVKQNLVMSVLKPCVIWLVPLRRTAMKVAFLTKPLLQTELKSVITVLNTFSHPTLNY